jgi:RHS repeat-associated protein
LITFKVGALVGSTIPVPTTQTQYTLDPVGNWPKKVTDGVTQTRTHNAVNEITAIDVTPLSYDNNGNLSADANFTYAYDEENRMTAVTRKSDGVVVGRYQYDALSRRVQKIANPSGMPATTRYFYDHARILEEQDAGGATQATYTYGNYIDEVLTMNRAGQAYYYHQNALWSVAAITNAAATIVESDAYDAYGAPATLASAIANPYFFTGRQLDAESGIYFYRARYYNSAEGRFLTRDPLGYSNGMNLYEYVRSRPTFAADPRGLAPIIYKGDLKCDPCPPARGPAMLCGTVEVELNWNYDRKNPNIPIGFRFTRAPVAGGANDPCKCCCPPDGKLGWIQHLKEPTWTSFKFDNGVQGMGAGGSGADSDPDKAGGQPTQETNPPANRVPPGIPEPKITDPGYDNWNANRWANNPWYGGHLTDPRNPGPQENISDGPQTPDGTIFRTQLVCQKSGKVLFDWEWKTTGQQPVAPRQVAGPANTIPQPAAGNAP